eukprot:TRINITY_DN9120_c0_g1_i4.p1 TRINITY_DN9120_c0_g1~~TRINITY_DN9120_c0_g1_i4.p1  ORF type:complete len:280 (-),score=63.17 TRINITY_DN9120_c0_g1_i4:159-998(-)
MSRHISSNYFEEEIDDDAFLRHPKSGSSGYILPQHNQASSGNAQGGTSAVSNNLDQKRQEMMQKRRDIEERTLASSERGIGVLYESEKVGLQTAEELSRQKEQLLRTEQRLDHINHTLRNSEKHIQGIKSVFGSLRNYFSGRNSSATGQQGGSSGGVSGNNQSTASSGVPSSMSTPTALDALHQNQRYQDHHPGLAGKPSASQSQAFHPASSMDVDTRLDQNLDEMASGLTRLKGLAMNLNDELADHNDLIDRINVKTEDTQFKIGKQNKDMNKILGKK